MKYYFKCQEDNELYQLIRNTGVICKRSNSTGQVLSEIEPDSFLCIFEDDYPKKNSVITKEMLEIISKKRIRVLIEYPREVYGIRQEKVKRLDRERIVCNETMMIGQNNCDYVIPFHVDKGNIIYSYAKVAGYRKAVYGLPDDSLPYLFCHDAYPDVVMTSSKISSPVSSRYKPVSYFSEMYRTLFSLELIFEESVAPSMKIDEKVSISEITDAVRLSTDWFKTYMLSIDYRGMKAYEGFSSKVNIDGSQSLADSFRNDCAGETSLVLALDHLRSNNDESRKLSIALMEYIFSDANQSLDMSKDEGGFIKWYANGDGIYYTDDNARLLMGVMTGCSVLNTNRFDEGIIKCILAFARSMPSQGIHMNCLRFRDSMITDDWTYEDLKTKKTINYSPHYVSYIWVVFLLTYGLTGDAELLSICKKGIFHMMERYPDKWKWTNGIMAEVSRMILPLSLLCHYDNDCRAEEYLEMMIGAVIEQTDENGCMIEKMILLENGKYPPPENNEDYGKYEAPVIQENGDTACDLLYSQNFAYLGLHEALFQVNDERIRRLSDVMTDFIVKIQTRSAVHPELNGVWMRSFDPVLWEYWGSGADAGWAALCVESGWTNSWLNIVLSLREMNKSLTDFFVENEEFKKMYYQIKNSIQEGQK